MYILSIYTYIIFFFKMEIWSVEGQGKRIWGILQPVDLCPAPSSLSMLPLPLASHPPSESCLVSLAPAACSIWAEMVKPRNSLPGILPTHTCIQGYCF